MRTSREHIPPSPSRRAMLVVTGVLAAVHIVGCTTDETESSNSTGGSGGNQSVAGADGGAADAGSAAEAGALRR